MEKLARAAAPRALLAAAAMIASFALADTAALAITVEAFARTPAAAAYREGRFAAALAELDILLRREPNDPLLLRVRGMALYRLDRLAEAEAALSAAAAAAPADPAARYWLGAVRHKRGNPRGALAAFEAVQRLSPDTRYGASAREFIAAIRRQETGPASAGDGDRRWTLSIAAGAQFDDNVSLVNRDRIESFRFFGEARGSHAWSLPHRLTLTLEGRAYGSAHPRRAADDFNVVLLSGGPALSWRTDLGSLPARLSLGYAFEYVTEGGRFYSSSHAITPKIDVGLYRDAVTTVGAVVGFDRFALADGSDPAIFSRDGMRYGAFARHVHYFDGERHNVWAGYEFTRYNTEGRNFEADAHVGSAGLALALPWGLALDLTAELGYTRYFNYVDTPPRRSLKQVYGVWLTKRFTPNLSLTAAYAHSFDDSNFRDFQTRRNLFTISGKYSF